VLEQFTTERMAIVRYHDAYRDALASEGRQAREDRADAAGTKLDAFVTLRGEIAHRGSAATSVTKQQVNEYYNHVKRLTTRTETRVAEAITTSTGTTPW